jgi:SOS-response transcriptional repressor LexA
LSYLTLSSDTPDAIVAAVTVLGESQIYRDLMRFKPEELSPNAWAVRAGVSRTVWSDMRRHGNPSRRTLEKLLVAAGSSLAEFEALRLGPQSRRPVSSGAAAHLGDRHRTWTPPPLQALPLVGSSLAGEWGEPGSRVELTEIRPRDLLDRLQRPVSLAGDPDAFALTVAGASMWPRFRPGARIAVSPRSPVMIGDDVVARLRPSPAIEQAGVEQVLIMHLARRAATSLELRQFNPDLVIQVDTQEVEALLKIAGELI